jgi:hypothetical protein
MDNLIFIPYKNSDMTEGRGPMIACMCGKTVIGCKTLELAEEIAFKQDRVMGVEPSHIVVKTCRIIDDMRDLKDLTDKTLIDKALAKLTDEEKLILGLHNKKF